MRNIAVMMRLMTHINVGATIALLAWLAGGTHWNGITDAAQRAGGRPPTATAEGKAR